VKSSRYSFGDDRRSSERMELVAAAYEPVSRAFLGSEVGRVDGAAVDLGCGPGFSTRLIAEVCRPGRLFGVDRGDESLREARTRNPGATFVVRDVLEQPLPGAPASLVYARLLLAHLPDPVTHVRAWLNDVAPGGCVAVEDLEDIEAPPGPLRDYEDLSAAMVRSAGGVMYAGRDLVDFGGSVRPVTVPAAVAARIYLFNVRRWAVESVPVDGAVLAELDRALTELTAGRGSAGSVSWLVRQVVLRA